VQSSLHDGHTVDFLLKKFPNIYLKKWKLAPQRVILDVFVLRYWHIYIYKIVHAQSKRVDVQGLPVRPPWRRGQTAWCGGAQGNPNSGRPIQEEP
jgi:hypothetical protein